MSDFTTSFVVDASPDEVFDAVNNVRGWWSGQIEGETDRLGAEFTYRYEDIHYSHQRIAELAPGQKVVWQVLDAYLNFTADPNEWTGTRISFELARKGERTEVRFSHLGLVPDFECFENCSAAWSFYINDSLRRLITTGRHKPNPQDRGLETTR